MLNKLKISLSKIKKDFSFLKEDLEKGRILAVLLYGSYAKNEQNVRSDIDICVVAPRYKTVNEISELLRYFWGNVNTNKYDVRTFEELPLYIKMSVIENNKIIYAKDKYKLYEYFYLYRKLWNDQSLHWIERKENR